MPAVCRFYLKGYCRYGRNCRFEHPGESSYTNDVVEESKPSFSFKSALSSIPYQQQIFDQTINTFSSQFQHQPRQQEQSRTHSSGFSFIKALETPRSRVDDVDMLLEETSHQFQSFSGITPKIVTNPIAVPVQVQTPAAATAITVSSSHTNQEELNKEELEAFRGDKFTYRKIPIRPPPQNLC